MSRTGINYTCNTAVSLGYVHTIPNRSCAGPRGGGGGGYSRFQVMGMIEGFFWV